MPLLKGEHVPGNLDSTQKIHTKHSRTVGLGKDMAWKSRYCIWRPATADSFSTPPPELTMAIDLKNLSPKELQALITGANAQMQEAHANQIRTAREKIDAVLRNAGLNLDEVYPTRRSKNAKTGKKSTVAPKFRNPASPDQTWSGRGKRPLWLSGALKKRGTTLESFLIEGASVAAATKKTAAKKAPRKQARKTAK